MVNKLLCKIYAKTERAGDGIRTHEIPPWEGGALPLGDTRLGNDFIEIEGICQCLSNTDSSLEFQSHNFG